MKCGKEPLRYLVSKMVYMLSWRYLASTTALLNRTVSRFLKPMASAISLWKSRAFPIS